MYLSCTYPMWDRAKFHNCMKFGSISYVGQVYKDTFSVGNVGKFNFGQ